MEYVYGLLQLFDARSFALAFLIFAPFEFLFPTRKDKGVFRNGWLIDVAHFFFSAILIRLGIFTAIWAATVVGTKVMPGAVHETIRSIPIWLQVILATLIADLGFYLSHRLLHTVPALWRFHAIHHSSEHMDWLASYRVHPVDQVIVQGTSLVPVFVLGFSEAAIVVAGIIYHWQALLIHSNVKLPFGPLKWVFASPEFHHWHHAVDKEAHDKNFSGQLPLWDMVFGTVHMPPNRMPNAYGVHEPIPDTYIGQLAYPFRKPEASEQTSGPSHDAGSPAQNGSAASFSSRLPDWTAGQAGPQTSVKMATK